jgi:hypothetical protein
MSSHEVAGVHASGEIGLGCVGVLSGTANALKLKERRLELRREPVIDIGDVHTWNNGDVVDREE